LPYVVVPKVEHLYRAQRANEVLERVFDDGVLPRSAVDPLPGASAVGRRSPSSLPELAGGIAVGGDSRALGPG
jgi:hypothetical protein